MPVVAGVALHANAIAKNRSAGERARGIDGDDADRLVLAAIVSREAVDQRALARSRSAGDPDAIGAPGVGKKLAQDFLGFARAIFDRGNGARKRARHRPRESAPPNFQWRLPTYGFPRSWRAITRR